MAANPHDRRAAAETCLALLAVVVFVASAGLVHHGSAQSVQTLERRLDLLAEFEALVPAEDEVGVVGREWYWLPVAGISTSAMPVGQIERMLGEMTMRTLGTLQRMVARFG